MQFSFKCFVCFAINFLGKVFPKENNKSLIHTQNLYLSEIFFLNVIPSIQTHGRTHLRFISPSITFLIKNFQFKQTRKLHLGTIFHQNEQPPKFNPPNQIKFTQYFNNFKSNITNLNQNTHTHIHTQRHKHIHTQRHKHIHTLHIVERERKS